VYPCGVGVVGAEGHYKTPAVRQQQQSTTSTETLNYDRPPRRPAASLQTTNFDTLSLPVSAPRPSSVAVNVTQQSQLLTPQLAAIVPVGTGDELFKSRDRRRDDDVTVTSEQLHGLLTYKQSLYSVEAE